LVTLKKIFEEKIELYDRYIWYVICFIFWDIHFGNGYWVVNGSYTRVGNTMKHFVMSNVIGSIFILFGLLLWWVLAISIIGLVPMIGITIITSGFIGLLIKIYFWGDNNYDK
jgi:hypothetical protein